MTTVETSQFSYQRPKQEPLSLVLSSLTVTQLPLWSTACLTNVPASLACHNDIKRLQSGKGGSKEQVRIEDRAFLCETEANTGKYRRSWKQTKGPNQGDRHSPIHEPR